MSKSVNAARLLLVFVAIMGAIPTEELITPEFEARELPVVAYAVYSNPNSTATIAEIPSVAVSKIAITPPAVFAAEIKRDPAPARLSIPSVKIDSPVEHLGLNAKGEMDVPSAKTNNVGWWKYGTVPGEVGSAVMDAHVFAAFENLKHVAAGDDVFVTTRDGERLHFVVTGMKTYPIAEVPLEDMFHRNDVPRLNLITCAGKRTPDGSTYDHRLVVYAELATSLSLK